MRNIVLGLALPLALAACGEASPRDANIEVENAWVRLPAVPGRPAAAYFHIRTDVGPATLVRVESPLAGRAEMHGPGMKPLANVAIAADSAFDFAPGGSHVMLFDVGPQVKPGGTIPLRLTFAGNPPPAVVQAKVIAAGDPAP